MTNKIAMRTVEEFLADYTPNYNPILPLFLPKSTQYPAEVGNTVFKRAEAVGDIRSKVITPKDTEIHQITSKEGSKGFKKYFYGSQYIQSDLQDRKGYEDVLAQVLDEHNKQADLIFMTGDSTDSGTTVLNNGLFYSKDPNYILRGSAAVSAGSDGGLSDLYAKIMAEVQTARDLDGEIMVLLYGDTTIAKNNSLFPATTTPFSKVLGDALADVTVARIPTAIVPSGNGYIVVNRSQVHLNYTMLPTIKDQGQNAEKMYTWTNFLMGSSMLDVIAKGAVAHQPLTF